MRRRRLGQKREKRRRVARLAQLRREARIAQSARDGGERLEMIGAGVLRRDQQKQQVDGQAVQRLEIDRPLESGENAENPAALRHFAVRDGYAVADASRAEPLALQKRVKNLPRGKSGDLSGSFAQLLQGLL